MCIYFLPVAISTDTPEGDITVDQANNVGDEISKLTNQYSIPAEYHASVQHPETKEGMITFVCALKY